MFKVNSEHVSHLFLVFILLLLKIWNNDEIVFGEFIALQKAFDTANHEALLVKLNHNGIRSKENDCFCSFVSNGKQYWSKEGSLL